jgi:hypothetical protein
MCYDLQQKKHALPLAANQAKPFIQSAFRWLSPWYAFCSSLSKKAIRDVK